MKKWFAGLALILLLLMASLYVFIPGGRTLSQVTVVNAAIDAAYRKIADEKLWPTWSDPRKDPSSSDLVCDGYTFRISKKTYNAMEITATNQRQTIETKLILFQLQSDSTAIKWEAALIAGSNPVRRLGQYREASRMKNCMTKILGNMQSFLKKKENIYGFDIRRTTLQDTVLLSTKASTSNYPTTSFIYGLIKNLKTYIARQGAKETNYPMLNIVRNPDSSYVTMVAIATNKELAGNENITLKRLAQIPNKILLTEVKGGPQVIDSSFNAINLYMTDYHLTAPVMPFQLLITDRSLEKDADKWITRIYYPII